MTQSGQHTHQVSRRGITRRTLLGIGAGAAGGLLLPSGAGQAFAVDDPYAVVRQNWFSLVTGLPFDPSMPSIKAAVETVGATARQHATTMQTAAGRTELWADLDLGTSSAHARTSFNRLKEMAIGYVTPGSGVTGDSALLAQVFDGLDFLMSTTYTTALPPRGYDNWWDWQIGIPNSIEDTSTLLFDQLGADQVAEYCARIDHFTPAATIDGSTGANRLWWCRILIVGGALSGDSAKIARGVAAMSPAFVQSLTGDGMYADGSFLQHTARVANVGGYGLAFLESISTLTNLLAGSPWPVTDPNLANVYAATDRGLVPSVWEGLTFESMRGRAISGSNSSDARTGLQSAGVLLRFAEGTSDANQASRWRSIAKGWLQHNPIPLSQAGTIDQISRFEDVLRDAAVAPAPEAAGTKLYYENDRAVHRRPGWAFGISGCSARIARYEMVNQSNLRGWHTGDGVTYLQVDSDRTQFSDAFWNTVDPYRLPGTTVDTVATADSAGANTRPTTTWTGGAVTPNDFGSGLYGTFGQDLEAFGSDLRAKKSWFFLDFGVVALGAGITANTTASIETIVENRNLHTDAGKTLTVDGRPQPRTTGWQHSFPAAQWAHLDGVAGYVFPGPARATLTAARQDRTGSWYDIDHYVGDHTTNTRPYLSLSFDHGAHPVDASYSYLVLPTATRRETEDRSHNPGYTVLANTPQVQAIGCPGQGLVMANFFAAATAGPFTSSGPAAVVLRRTPHGVAVSVADPTRSRPTVTLRIDHAALQKAGVHAAFLTAGTPSDGVTVLSSDSGSTTLLVEIGGTHGASRTVDLSNGTRPAPPNQAHFLTPSADATVRDGSYGDTTFGADSHLDLKKSGSGTGNTGFSRRALLRFDTAALDGPVRRAILWLNGRTNDSGGLQGELQAFAVGNGWSEDSVTWNNAPALSTPLGTGQLSASTDWVGLDVTAAFATTPTAQSFGLWQPDGVTGLLMQFASREASTGGPVLEIVSGPSS